MMPSKLLNVASPQTSPLPWRHGNSGAPLTGTAFQAPSSAPLGETDRLRKQIAENSAEAERNSKKAYDTGFRAGEQAARQNSEREMKSCGEKLAQTIAETVSLREQTIRRAEEDTVRLALEIARRVLHRELTVDPSAIEALVKAALEKVKYQEIYRVRVHPTQEHLVRQCLLQMGRGSEVDIVIDPTQARGGATFEINRGVLDASVETQLQEIERGLVDEIEIRK